MPAIHPNALGEADSIGANSSIGEFAVLRAGAVLGEDVTIHPHVVIEPGVEIGNGVEVLPGTYLGRTPRATRGIARQPTFSPRLQVGEGCLIGAQLSLDRDVRVGAGVRVMHKPHLTGHTRIGDGAFIGPLVSSVNDNAMGRGGYREERVQGPVIGEGAMIGGGAALLPGVSVGSAATFAAGAVVTKDVEDGTTVMGVPARPA